MTDTIAVLAAQGRSGRACVQALLQAGYRVRAGVRTVGTFAPHPLLDEIPCDVLRHEDVSRLLDGASAVVSMIGHNRRSSPTVQSTAIRHCLDIIGERQPDTRLVSLTGTGVRLPGDRIPLLDRLANTAIALVDPQRIADGKEHVRMLQASPVRFTILRVLKLMSGTHHGDVRLTPHGPAELLTPRARVAAAVVQLLREGTFVRELPVISGRSRS